ncbi:ParB/RepB/Spo0J family partition protein [Candidatus Latescibacterota bacterium]
MQRKALGKGLDALFRTPVDKSEADNENSALKIITVPINEIIPNRNQPRERFSDEAMDELKKSIAENGILEPPIVRRKDDFFEVIAGERRYRAARELHFDTIDVILMDVESDEKALVLSLIENIQREDLNAIEEAKAYQQIMTDMSVTQEELAAIVSRSRSAVANTIRLLTLTERVQKMVSEGILAAGSARALVTVQDPNLQFKLANKIASGGLSARKAEALVKRSLPQKPEEAIKKELSPFVEAIREDIQRIMGTDVKINGNDGKGKIEITYYSPEDLERILDILKGNSQF